MKTSRTRAGRPDGQPGFTLIELMVALVVLTIGLFSIIHLQVITVRGHAYARERIEAYEIAYGIVQNLRTRARAWVDLRAIDQPFSAIFPGITWMNPGPLPGSAIPITELHAFPQYAGATLSIDGDPQNAMPINVFGRNPIDNTGLDGARGAYRVHYVAHWIDLRNPLDPLDPTTVTTSERTLRLTLFVSWESKDHGTDLDWGNWWNAGANFCDRHMVTVTTFIRQARHW